jgi:hypothetical protein
MGEMRSGPMQQLDCRPGSRKRPANVGQIRVLVAEKVNVFVVAEKCVYGVSFRQNVASPTVQHGQLQEGCEVFRFLFQEKVPRPIVKLPIVAIRLKAGALSN